LRLGAGALDVDDRRFARHGDGFLERADGELCVQRRGEFSRQVQSLALQRAEPGQREVDGVDARPQIDHFVDALCIRHRRAHALDERRTRGFNGDSRQHAARGIAYHTGNAALRPRGSWNQKTRRDDYSPHILPSQSLDPPET
jgi:hypothetical protein